MAKARSGHVLYQRVLDVRAYGVFSIWIKKDDKDTAQSTKHLRM
jgi:hypothetical protein